MRESNAVLYSWHKENCGGPLHGHPSDHILVCSECGKYVQPPSGYNVKIVRGENGILQDIIVDGYRLSQHQREQAMRDGRICNCGNCLVCAIKKELTLEKESV